MPEPLPAGSGTPTEQTASTQQATTPADKQTIPSSDPLMDALNIPKDVQSQIISADSTKDKAKSESTQPEPVNDGAPTPEPPEPTPGLKPQAEQPRATLDDEGDDDDDEPLPQAQGDQPPKVDKRQKRINRLTRQKSQLEDENAQLRDRLTKVEGEHKPADKSAATVPSATGRLAHITDERQLTQEIGKSEAVVDWCDAHSEGESLTEEQIDPKFKAAYTDGRLTLAEAKAKTVAGWKSEAEKVLLSAPNRRDEIRTYNQERTWFDNVSKQAWPELFEKGTVEYQLKNEILNEFPHFKGTAQENYAVGLAIEGMKSLKGRVAAAQKNGNGADAKTAPRDISPRAFEPRVPIAPTTAEPPLRDAREANAVSSQQKVSNAMSALVKDPDGSLSSLAAVLAAEDEAAGTQSGTARARAPVKV